MKKIIFLFVVLFFILNQIFLRADDAFIGFGAIKERSWGGIVRDWPSIFKMSDVVKVRGPRGMLGIRLSDNFPEVKNNTELLLHFDRVSFGRIMVDGSSYSLKYSDVYPSINIKVMGDGACAFQHIGSSIELTPREVAQFYPGKKLGSFTLSFYLYPTMLFDGETVISMLAPSIRFDNQLTGFKLYFKDNRLKWSFLNIFNNRTGGFNENNREISIEEVDPSPIYEWHHHLLSYNADRGIMTLFVDGKISAIKWVTDNGKEDGTILDGRLDNSLTVPLIIGGNFVGYMDELLLSRGAKNTDKEVKDGRYRENGEIVSDVLQFKTGAVKIAKIKWDSVEKNGTAVRVMYRISDNYFLPDGNVQKKETKDFHKTDAGMRLRNEPEWKMAKNGHILEDKGRYFQWKAVLYGTNGMYTPILKSLNLYYEEDLPPSKPILLSAIPGDSKVNLKWVSNKEDDIAGYRIYYGNYSHNYFGKGSNFGDSPITVGNTTSIELKNLINEKVYFFSITALDKSGQESGFSKEMIARPSKIYEDQ